MMDYCIKTCLFAIEWSCIKYSLKHFLRAGCMFNNCTFRGKITFKNSNASILPNRLIIWSDYIFLSNIYIVTLVEIIKPLITSFIESICLKLFKILTKSLSCNSHYIQMEVFLDFFHDSRYTACIVEALCRPLSCRADIKKILRAAVESVEGVTCDLDSKLMSDRRKVE